MVESKRKSLDHRIPTFFCSRTTKEKKSGVPAGELGGGILWHFQSNNLSEDEILA